MRWLGVALVLTAGLLLAWDSFRVPAHQPDPVATRGTGQQSARLISGIGITSGLLLIVIGARKFDRGESASR